MNSLLKGGLNLSRAAAAASCRPAGPERRGIVLVFSCFFDLIFRTTSLGQCIAVGGGLTAAN